MLSYAKSATARYGDRLNGFEKGKTKLFNSWEVGKLDNFHKKVECSFKMLIQFAQCDLCFYNVCLYLAKHILFFLISIYCKIFCYFDLFAHLNYQ